MSTASGTSTPNAFQVSAGTHTRFNYGFTAPGLYDVEFTASGTLSPALGGGPVTGTAALLVLAAAGSFMAWGRRRNA